MRFKTKASIYVGSKHFTVKGLKLDEKLINAIWIVINLFIGYRISVPFLFLSKRYQRNTQKEQSCKETFTYYHIKVTSEGKSKKIILNN